MKKVLFLFILVSMGCGGKPSLNDADKAYIHTTLDLLRIRASFVPNEDSTAIKRSLDSVYTRHRTSVNEYRMETEALSKDPDRTSAIFAAINDSIGK